MRTMVVLLSAAALAACAHDVTTAPDPTAATPSLSQDAGPASGRFGGPGRVLMSLRRLPDNLKLTDAQRTQVKALLEDFGNATKADREAMRALMKEVFAARKAGQSREQIRQLLAQGQPIRERLRQAGEALKQKIQGVLTADQKAWLAANPPTYRSAGRGAFGRGGMRRGVGGGQH